MLGTNWQELLIVAARSRSGRYAAYATYDEMRLSIHDQQVASSFSQSLGRSKMNVTVSSVASG